MLSGTNSRRFCVSSRSVRAKRPFSSEGSSSRRFSDTSRHTSLRRFPSSYTDTHIQLQINFLTFLRLWIIYKKNQEGRSYFFGLTAGNVDNWFRSSQSSLRLGRAPRVSGWEIKYRVGFFYMTGTLRRRNCFDLPKLPVHYCPDPAVPV